MSLKNYVTRHPFARHLCTIILPASFTVETLRQKNDSLLAREQRQRAIMHKESLSVSAKKSKFQVECQRAFDVHVSFRMQSIRYNKLWRFNALISRRQYLSLSSSFPFVRGELLPATFSPPHLLVFSILLCLLSSSSSDPVFLFSCLPHISLNTVLPSQPRSPSSPQCNSAALFGSLLSAILSTCPAHCKLLLTSLSVKLLCTHIIGNMFVREEIVLRMSVVTGVWLLLSSSSSSSSR